MAFITFRCTSCNQGLKVPDDKAGRKVKCTKCGTGLTVPATSQAAAPAAPAKPAKRPFDDDEDDGSAYGVEDAEAEAAKLAEEARLKAERERRRKEQEEEDQDEDLDPEEIAERDEALRRRLLGLPEDEDEEEYEEEEEEARPRKRKKFDPKAWGKVRVGLQVMLVAVGLAAGALLLHQIYIIIGLTADTQYAKTLQEIHPHYRPGGEGQSLDLPKLIFALVGGLNNVTTSRALLVISAILALLQHAVVIAGAAICLAIPPRYGSKGLALATLVLAAVNVVTTLVFWVLPAVGAMNFTLVPLVGAELPMLDANQERLVPLQLLWSGAPYLQVELTVFVLILTFGELVLFPLYLRAAALALKSELLDEAALTLVQLALAQLFMQVAYQLLAMTGTTDVLGWIIKSVYVIALGFYIGQLAWFAVVLVRGRTVIAKALKRQ